MSTLHATPTKNPYALGRPLCAHKFFTGPITWWCASLTCGGIERQIITGAKYFYDKGYPITLLCRNAEERYGTSFFLQDAHKYCKQVHLFSLEALKEASRKQNNSSIEINIFSFFDEIRERVPRLFPDCTPYFRDAVACYTLWMLQVRPRLLQIWSADYLDAIVAAAIAGIPHIVIAGRSLSPRQRAPYGFESVDDAFAFAVLSKVICLPNVVLTNNSRAGCRDYENWLNLPDNSVYYTPNAFDFSQWRQPAADEVVALRSKLQIPESAQILGGLFRFVSIKDPELWVCTALRACSKNHNLYAVIGGDGPELERLKRTISDTSFSSRILFPGIIKDIPSFMHLCDVFLHTSFVEGFPNTILEAQAYGIPVVSTRCGGAPDIVIHGKSGFIVDDRDETALSHYVNFILMNKNFLSEASYIAKKHIRKNFTSTKSLSILHSLYKNIFKKTH